MRLLVDAQLPPALAHHLASKGHEARAVREVGLREANDGEIWDFALADGWTIVTKDEDFVSRRLQVEAGPQIVWLRIGNSTNAALLAWLDPLWPDVERELATGSEIVEVA